MTGIVMVFSAFLAAVLQTVLPEIGAHGLRLPLLQGVVVYYALTRRVGATLAAGFFAGLLHDALGLAPLGYSVVCFCVAGAVVNRFRDVVFNESMFTAAFFGALFAGISTLVTGLALCGAGLLDIGVWQLLLKTGAALLAGAVCAPLVFRILSGLDRAVGNAPRRREPIDEEIGYTRA